MQECGTWGVPLCVCVGGGGGGGGDLWLWVLSLLSFIFYIASMLCTRFFMSPSVQLFDGSHRSADSAGLLDQ